VVQAFRRDLPRVGLVWRRGAGSDPLPDAVPPLSLPVERPGLVGALLPGVATYMGMLGVLRAVALDDPVLSTGPAETVRVGVLVSPGAPGAQQQQLHDDSVIRA